MAWETRRGRQYLYRSERNGAHVRKLYVGRGAKAEQAARELADAKAQREHDRAEATNLEARLAAADQITAEGQQGAAQLVEATLLVVGYHNHRGEWRHGRTKRT